MNSENIFFKSIAHYHHMFTFARFFSSPLLKDLNLKFRIKFNHDFTNHGYWHGAILKIIQF